MAGDDQGAASALGEAKELYEQKGNIVAAERVASPSLSRRIDRHTRR